MSKVYTLDTAFTAGLEEIAKRTPSADAKAFGFSSSDNERGPATEKFKAWIDDQRGIVEYISRPRLLEFLDSLLPEPTEPVTFHS